jgi:putative nucleotidyltransferase with HDIG domain
MCSTVTEFLITYGFSVSVARNGQAALEMFHSVKPDVILTDLCMPGISGLDFLEKIRHDGCAPSVIVMTGNPDMSSAIGALQRGACDYLLKPFPLPMLVEKIRKAVDTTRLARDNIVLSEIVSLYTITSKLSATHNMEALLDVVFKHSLELTGSSSGAIYLRGSGSNELLSVRRQWPKKSPEDVFARGAIAKRVFSSGIRLVVENGSASPQMEIIPECAGIHALLCIPLRVGRETIGVLVAERSDSSPFFSALDLNRGEVLSSQAGIAINNADLYNSLKKKLEDLNLVSNFTHQIMGRLDKYDLIRSLFEKVKEQGSADVIGYLLIKQRYHEFLYWTRDSMEEDDLRSICREVTAFFNEKSSQSIADSRVTLKAFTSQLNPAGPVKLPLAFKQFLPVIWEENAMGALFVGASVKKPENVAGEALVAGLVNQVRIALSNTKLYNDMKENYIKTIKALAIAVDAKDAYTHGHSEKVMTFAEELAVEMKEFDSVRVSVIRDAALLHDIGKIGVPGNILNKTASLTFEEWNGYMKNHSQMGANIVKDVPFLTELYLLILHHHENWDGTGYPYGLKGDEIPIEARVLHVADAFDAMTSDRPYRKDLGHEEAIRRIAADSGKQFDPTVVEAFLRVVRRKGLLA